MKEKLLIFFLFLGLFSCKKEVAEIKYESQTFDLNAEAFMKKYKDTPNAQLVDVRTELEYKDGHIQYAILIDFYAIDFKAQLAQKLDKSKPVFLYCRSGNRSKQTLAIMKEMGFKEINNLTGGYNEIIHFTEECRTKQLHLEM